MWSPVEQTALAEAEIEYADRKAQMIWVKFPIARVFMETAQAESGLQFGDASVVIWTTTPWTIPANRAVSFNPEIAYGLYECETLEQGLAFEPWIKPGDKLIIADKLAESVMKAAKAGSWKRISDVNASALQDMTLSHPCPLYTSDAADQQNGANLGGRPYITQKTKTTAYPQH